MLKEILFQIIAAVAVALVIIVCTQLIYFFSAKGGEETFAREKQPHKNTEFSYLVFTCCDGAVFRAYDCGTGMLYNRKRAVLNRFDCNTLFRLIYSTLSVYTALLPFQVRSLRRREDYGGKAL